MESRWVVVMIMEVVKVVMAVKKRKPCTYRLLAEYVALIFEP